MGTLQTLLSEPYFDVCAQISNMVTQTGNPALMETMDAGANALLEDRERKNVYLHANRKES